MEKYIDYLVGWLQDKVKETKTQGIVFGVSGGIDSAVVAGLASRAFNDKALGLIMPCFSAQEDVDHALIVVNDFNLDHRIIDLDATFTALITNEISSKIDVTDNFKMASANTKARLRMTSLYAIAQNNNYLVCGTDNACEWHTGYFTKYGDGGVDIAPLVQLTKTQVYEMARLLKVDYKIIEKAPSAGLIEGVNDEDEMKVTYQELEDYLANKPVSLKSKERIEFLHNTSEHKRNVVAFPKIKVGEL